VVEPTEDIVEAVEKVREEIEAPVTPKKEVLELHPCISKVDYRVDSLATLMTSSTFDQIELIDISKHSATHLDASPIDSKASPQQQSTSSPMQPLGLKTSQPLNLTGIISKVQEYKQTVQT
jgi:hypothetical protein